jgi:hypothetical protein
MRDFDLRNYLLGFLSAAIVSVIMYFVLMGGSGSSNFTQISVDQAHKYYLNYYTHATTQQDILKGFTFDSGDYFQSVSALYAHNSAISGYRIYMGFDDSGKEVGILVGINSAGDDMTGGHDLILSVSGKMGPCPNICDNNSPITAEAAR